MRIFKTWQKWLSQEYVKRIYKVQKAYFLRLHRSSYRKSPGLFQKGSDIPHRQQVL